MKLKCTCDLLEKRVEKYGILHRLYLKIAVSVTKKIVKDVGTFTLYGSFVNRDLIKTMHLEAKLMLLN